jgi:hypothetical protein
MKEMKGIRNSRKAIYTAEKLIKNTAAKDSRYKVSKGDFEILGIAFLLV